jgi:hypothetical protein
MVRGALSFFTCTFITSVPISTLIYIHQQGLIAPFTGLWLIHETTRPRADYVLPLPTPHPRTRRQAVKILSPTTIHLNSLHAQYMNHNTDRSTLPADVPGSNATGQVVMPGATLLLSLLLKNRQSPTRPRLLLLQYL